MPVSRIREIMELAWADPEAIHLEVGEPDFPTPEHVVEAAHEAARMGLTRYAPNAGLPELREALADKVARRNGYGARPEQVVVTQGGIQALYLALRALLEPGDEVLLPDPAWPNYRMIAHLLGARVLSYPLVAGGGFLPRPEDLERLATPRTRAMLVNSPSNPLGTVVPRELMEGLLAFARGGACGSSPTRSTTRSSSTATSSARGRWPTGRSAGLGLLLLEGLRDDRLARGLPGGAIRDGQAPHRDAGADRLVRQHPRPDGGPGRGDRPARRRQGDERLYRARRDELLGVLDRGGLPSSRPSGAFYVWADVSEAGVPSMDLARSLIEREHVAVAPGSAFGELGEGYVRLSLASAREDLLEGTSRLVRFVRLLGEARR
jgi:aspartate/methionine/tyrosine aminotransferase